VTAVEASRCWHQAQEHRVQAEAAGRAGRLLHEAVEMTVGVNAAREYTSRPERTAARKGTGLRAAAEPGTRLMVGVVEEAVPEHARDVLADPAWPALRSRLAAMEKAGDDPPEVLALVARRRELTSADSVAEVLTWRLDGWSRQRGATAAATGKAPSPTPPGGTGRTSGPRTTGAPGPTRRPPGDEQRRGPRRAR
jgi:hypothetical protein